MFPRRSRIVFSQMSQSVEREEEGTDRPDSSQCVEREEEGTDRPDSSQCVEREEEGTDRPDSPTFRPICRNASIWRPPDFNDPGPMRSVSPPGPSHTHLNSITALPLSAADMRRSWHKDIPQLYRDFHVRRLVDAMSTGDPVEDIKDLVTDAQNIERSIYESANSRHEYWELKNEKISESERRKKMRIGCAGEVGELEDGGSLDHGSDINTYPSSWTCGSLRTEVGVKIDGGGCGVGFRMEVPWTMDQTPTCTLPPEFGVPCAMSTSVPCRLVESPWRFQMEVLDQTSTCTLPPGDKTCRWSPSSEWIVEETPEETYFQYGVTESLSPLELQDETDHLSSCFKGLRMEDSVSLPRSHSLPTLSQIPCLENMTGFIAKRSHSVNDVTLLDKAQKFTPDIIVVENEESYRFHCTRAGLFRCSVTSLVIKMETEGDVIYRTVPWHRRLLSQLSKRPAGPLFDIKGPQGSVCQLHFPHCEILSTGGGKYLSVVHVMDDDGIELIKPHVITETHVIINATGLSLFGIIKEKLFGPSPIQALVSLFYTPPMDGNDDDDDDDPSSIMKVLLLPGNVVLDEVKKRRRKLVGEEIYIGNPPCKLIPKQEYTLTTSAQEDSIIIQPDIATFEVDESSYHNYIETFDVILKGKFKHVTLLLGDNNICAWKRCVYLSAPALRRQHVQRTLSCTPDVEERLFSVRSSFIDNVSLPNLNGLLDKLLATGIITEAERETAAEMQMRNNKARFVIDTVRRKGPHASSAMISILCDLDTFLSEHLGLMTGLTN